MAKEWADKKAIMMDLRKLGIHQGGISDCVHDKPPPFMMPEETEEEYYRQWSGCAPCGDGPDLEVISKMLSMRHDVEKTDGEEVKDAQKENVVITKLNPAAPEFKPKTDTDNNQNKISPTQIEQLATELKEKITCAPKTQKGKREKNAAVLSLLKVYAGVKPTGYDTQPDTDKKVLRLLKPDDFIRNRIEYDQPKVVAETKEVVDIQPIQPKLVVDTESIDDNSCKRLSEVEKESIEKVNSWNVGQTQHDEPKKGPVMLIPCGTSMFKRKARSPKEIPSSPITVKSSSSPVSYTSRFKPSEHADELYNQFQEKAAAKTVAKEDVWTKAINDMKEKEAKKRLEDKPFVMVLGNGVAKELPGCIRLAAPRHSLPTECIVCSVLCSKREPLEELAGHNDTKQDAEPSRNTLVKDAKPAEDTKPLQDSKDPAGLHDTVLERRIKKEIQLVEDWARWCDHQEKLN